MNISYYETQYISENKLILPDKLISDPNTHTHIYKKDS